MNGVIPEDDRLTKYQAVKLGRSIKDSNLKIWNCNIDVKDYAERGQVLNGFLRFNEIAGFASGCLNQDWPGLQIGRRASNAASL